MRPATRIRLPPAASAFAHSTTAQASRHAPLPYQFRPHTTPCTTRGLHMTPTAPRRADVVPMYGQGPPPHAPAPESPFAAATAATAAKEPTAATEAKEDPSATKAREAREREEVEQTIRIARRKAKAAAIAKGRFWKTTSVKEVDGKLQVHLDTRALRHPATKEIIEIPAHKKLLAHALATEWDQLTSVRQATQGHRVPLTSLVCRALDLQKELEETTPAKRRVQGDAAIENLMRYLDTDSLLCWAPADEVDVFSGNTAAKLLAETRATEKPEVTLRQMQEQTAAPILAYVKEHVWPGVVVEPVLGNVGQDSFLFPKAHPAETRTAVAAWLRNLDGWDLAGVERATLTGKSLVVAARFVGGVSRTATQSRASGPVFTADEAFKAANLETAFQTSQWGEVEDTHDVEQADMRRQFGSVVLLVG